MTFLVEARDLGRFYGDVVGLSDVSLAIEPGIVGLLGPNGAGKSTFLKLLVGELRPSRGSIRVLGLDPFANRELYRQMGFAPQQDALYGEMSGFEFVRFLLALSGYSAREAGERSERALARVKLTDAMHQKTRGYSKGMRQRTKLAQAIAHDPRVLVLDEPMTGLDPLARRDALELFVELGQGGMSILASTHVLHEVEALTKNILLLHRGRLLAQGGIADIRRLLAKHPRQVDIRAREPRRLARALMALDGVRSVELRDGGVVHLETLEIDQFFADLPAIAAHERAGIQSLDSSDAGLEAVFDYLVGETA